jgi:hypothetical protein
LALRDGAGHDELVRRHVERACAEHGNSIRDPELTTALNQCAAQAQQQLLDGMPRAPVTQ